MGLVCELCGGSNFVKKDGAFECQDCGCKYSVEEARALMSGGAAATSAPRASVAPVVHDNSAQIKNMLANAKSSYDAGSYSTAFNQCNEILNLAPKNFDALLYKGLSAGMQSSVANPRLREAGKYIAEGIKTLISDIPTSGPSGAVRLEAAKISADVILAYKMFYVVVDLNVALFNDYYIEQLRACTARKSSANSLISLDDLSNPNSRYNSRIREIENDEKKYKDENLVYNNMCMEVLCSVYYPYAKYASDCDVQEMLEHDDLEVPISLIESQLDTAEKRIRHYVSTSNGDLASVRKLCSNYKFSVKEAARDKNNREMQKAQEAYWAEHAEEKAALEQEKAALEAEIEGLNDQLKPFDARIEEIKREENAKKNQIIAGLNSQISGLEQEIPSLKNSMNSLGVFKGKEKKQLQEQIAQKTDEIKSLKARVDEADEQSKIDTAKRTRSIANEKTPILQEINRKKDRITEIEAKFTKDRRQPAE